MNSNLCPYCGSRNVAKILYGFNTHDSIQEKMDKGEVVLGGCYIDDRSPAHKCNTCGQEFGYYNKAGHEFDMIPDYSIKKSTTPHTIEKRESIYIYPNFHSNKSYKKVTHNKINQDNDDFDTLGFDREGIYLDHKLMERYSQIYDNTPQDFRPSAAELQGGEFYSGLNNLGGYFPEGLPSHSGRILRRKWGICQLSQRGLIIKETALDIFFKTTEGYFSLPRKMVKIQNASVTIHYPLSLDEVIVYKTSKKRNGNWKIKSKTHIRLSELDDYLRSSESKNKHNTILGHTFKFPKIAWFKSSNRNNTINPAANFMVYLIFFIILFGMIGTYVIFFVSIFNVIFYKISELFL